MKNIFTILVTLFTLTANLYTEECQAQWVQMGTFYDCTAFIANGNIIFVTTKTTDPYQYTGGIRSSTNNGTNWTYLGGVGPNRALAISGINLIVGCEPYGILLSTNNGLNWNQAQLNSIVYSLVSTGNKVYAGTYGGGVFISTNNGNNWTQTTLNNKNVYSLAVSGNYVFAGTYDLWDNYGVFLSSNNGTNWTQTALNDVDVYALAVVGNNVFAGTSYSGIYRSTNNGSSWFQSGLNNQSVMSFAVSGNNIFAGSDSGVYLTTNYGTSWINESQGFGSNRSVLALLIANNYIFAGASTVWRRILSEMIGVNNISTEIPTAYSLSQNYPNPFNPTTSIKFNVAKLGYVKIVIYDVTGREVQTIVNESLKPGTYETSFDGSSLNSGVYFYKIIAEEFSETKKMLLIK